MSDLLGTSWSPHGTEIATLELAGNPAEPN
jgi:hypothetical protein